MLLPPNVPTKCKGSFFNRKYRELINGQLTPTTPKLDKSHGSVHRSLRRSGGVRKVSPKGSGHSKQAQNCYLDAEYSTPKTTRAPSTVSGGRIRCDKNPCIIYAPLALDNESSSESMDNLMLYRAKIRRLSQDAPSSPLAIEEPPNESETRMPEFNELRSSQQQPDEPAPKKHRPQDTQRDLLPQSQGQTQIVTQVIDEEPSFKRVIKTPPTQSPPLTPKGPQPTNSSHKPTEQTECQPQKTEKAQTLKLQREQVEVKQAKLETPPKPRVKLPAFVPGSCNIDEILKFYGPRPKNSSKK